MPVAVMAEPEPTGRRAGGLALPCADDPDLFFAESPDDVELAKSLCSGCPARMACLAGAVERGSHGVSGAASCSSAARSCRASGRADARVRTTVAA